MIDLFRIKACITLTLCIFLVACGGGSSEKVVAPDPVTDGLKITVQDGLNATLDNSNLILDIPTQAIDVDTTLYYSKASVNSELISQGIITDLHTLSPPSTALIKYADIKIKIPTDYTKDTKLSISRLENNIWYDNLSSVKDEGYISAKINQLGTYAIREVTSTEITKNIGPACVSSNAQQSIKFVHVADLHSRFGYNQHLFSKIKHYHKESLKKFPFTVFTNGGDDYEKGTVAEQISQGQATVDAIKAMEFDVRVIGNHDYAWGPEQVIDYANDEKAIVLASNTQYTGGAPEDFKAAKFSTIQIGCIKVGFFGMTSVPWNELDEPVQSDPIPDFISNFKMNWEWQQVAQSIIDDHRQDVDFMVMVSHLGAGGDNRIASRVPGVDLVLGGHTHGGESIEQLTNGAILIQPNFFAQGLTDLTLNFDTQSKKLIDYQYQTVLTEQIENVDPETKNKIDFIMGKYAPDALTEIGVSENYPTKQQVLEITSHASAYLFNTNAALLDPFQVQDIWTPGGVSQEDFHATFYVERQPSNTPGFNSIYQVTVTGENLKIMANSQPDWFFFAPTLIDNTKIYRVALQKGPALNPELFFNNVNFLEVSALSESWWALDQYARYRTSQCLHIDTFKTLNSCLPETSVTIWNFNDSTNPFTPDMGSAVLSFYDPQNRQWGFRDTIFAKTDELSLPALPDGPSGVMAFTRHNPQEGLKVKHNSPPNGDFINQSRVSDYTLVMDILWPSESQSSWRALLQTDPNNIDDAELYVDKKGGIGIATRDSGFFGELKQDTWYRIAFVFYSAPKGGVLKVYIDGELVGVKDEGEIDQRWALDSYFLLLTDNDYETKSGYLNSLLYAGRAMTSKEIKSIGGPSSNLIFNPSIQQLNSKVERHYQTVPFIKKNEWMEQRNKFFNSKRSKRTDNDTDEDPIN